MPVDPAEEAMVRAYLQAQAVPPGGRFQSFAASMPAEQLYSEQPGPVASYVEAAPPVDPYRELGAGGTPGDLGMSQGGWGQRVGQPLAVGGPPTVPISQAMPGQASADPSRQQVSAPRALGGTAALVPPAAASTMPAGAPQAPPGAPPAVARPAGRGGSGSPLGPPPWLRKAMGAEAEGVVRQPRGLTVNPLTKEGAAALGEAETEGFQAQRAQGEASIQAANDIADRAVQVADEREAIAARFVERDQQRQNHLRTMEADYRQMADNLANTPIEQPDIWGGSDAGHQILGRVALFLGTLGSGVAGTPNIVWEKLKGDVDRNIEVQKANKALQQNRLAAEGTLIGMARERFASEAMQDVAMRQAAYEKIMAQLEAYKEQARTPERVAGLDALMAQTNIGLTQVDEQRRALMETAELNERRARAAASARPDPLDALVRRAGKFAKLKGYEREISGEADPKDFGAVPLWNTRVPKESAKDARDLSANVQALKGSLQEYANMSAGDSGVSAAQDRLTIQLKKLAGQGFSSDADMALLSSQIPNPSNPNFKKRLEQLTRSVQNTEQSAKRALGVPVVPTTKAGP